MASREPSFTRRERAILRLLAEGYKTKEIADELYISEGVLKEDHDRLMKKLSARNRSSIINNALQRGIISAYEVLQSRFSKRKLETS